MRVFAILLLPIVTKSFIPVHSPIHSSIRVNNVGRSVFLSNLKSFSIDDVDFPSDSSSDSTLKEDTGAVGVGVDGSRENGGQKVVNGMDNDAKYTPKYNDFIDTDSNNIGGWKETLDSLLSPQTPPQLRVTLLKDLLTSDEEIRSDVMKAIEGRDPEILLTSNAKALRDGTNAVAYQITNDIIPGLTNPLSPTNPNELRTSVPKAASQIFNAVQTQVENFSKGDDVTSKVKDGMNAVAKSVRDAVSMEGDEGPPYTVLLSLPTFEVRRYPEYGIASTTMREVGGKWDENDVVLQGVAFNLLAGYVFGGNEERKVSKRGRGVWEGH